MARNGGDGVDTYSEPSIGANNEVFTKIIPQRERFLNNESINLRQQNKREN